MAQVTVLMTVYNGARYLSDSVASVLKQTFHDFEFLIVDDGSTDHSLEIIQGFKDERIHVHRNALNIGQTRSLNVGLKLAQGRLIARMDSDDLAYPSWLATQVKFIEENTKYAVVSTKAAVIDNAGRVLRVLNSSAMLEEIVLKSIIASPINHVGSLMNKENILAQGGYDENFQFAADFDLWSRLLRSGHYLTSTPNVGVAIRFHPHSTSVREQGKNDIREVSRIIRENIKTFASQDVTEHEAALICKLIYNPGDFDDVQFLKIRGQLKDIYHKMQIFSRLDLCQKENIIQKQDYLIGMKKIFDCIKNKDLISIRHIARAYTYDDGFMNSFGLTWAISFLGHAVLGAVPRVYESYRRVNGQLKLQGKI